MTTQDDREALNALVEKKILPWINKDFERVAEYFWFAALSHARSEREGDSTRQVLQNVRNCLERINNEESAITDTLWYSDHETLFDYIDAELERVPGRGLPIAAAPTADGKS